MTLHIQLQLLFSWRSFLAFLLKRTWYHLFFGTWYQPSSLTCTWTCRIIRKRGRKYIEQKFLSVKTSKNSWRGAVKWGLYSTNGWYLVMPIYLKEKVFVVSCPPCCEFKKNLLIFLMRSFDLTVGKSEPVFFVQILKISVGPLSCNKLHTLLARLALSSSCIYMIIHEGTASLTWPCSLGTVR